MNNSLDNISPFKETFDKTHAIMSKHEGENIRIAYSGGADSDIVMWIFKYLGYNVPAVLYNAGLEYKATFEHVEYMREQGFDIEIVKPKYSIPYVQKKWGTPFLNKHVSQMMHRLQIHNFQFKNYGHMSFEELYKIYPNSKGSLQWWTNSNRSKRLNIEWNRGLKEFLIQNDGLPFHTSERCCDKSKKDLMKHYSKEHDISLVITGIRKAEGGRRSTSFTSCYLSEKYNPYAMYFPLFWWKQEDIELFQNEFQLEKSKCYTLYGMPRTGCAGCPYGRGFEDELKAIEVYEPKLYKLANHVFRESYEVTRKYRKFIEDGYEKLEGS